MDSIHKILSLFVLATLFVSPAMAAQDLQQCDNTGKYCVNEFLVDCINGEPEIVDECELCENAECVSDPIRPDINYGTPDEPGVPGSSYIIYIIVALVLVTILILAVKAVRRKKVAE